MTNLDKIMNDISMTTKIRIVNAMVFSSNKLQLGKVKAEKEQEK